MNHDVSLKYTLYVTQKRTKNGHNLSVLRWFKTSYPICHTMNINYPRYSIFELCDPSEPDIPIVIVWGRPGLPARLWRDRAKVPGELGKWLRSLSEPPSRLLGRTPGGLWSASRCRTLIARRVARIRRACGRYPAFLRVPTNSTRRKPVCRDCGGSVVTYRSINQAAQETGYVRHMIREWLYTGYPDSGGCFWTFMRS